MAPEGRTVEQILAALAGEAHGVVDRVQLLGAGISADEIKHRVRIGALIPEFRGVYRVGHRAPSVEARYVGASRACGPGAVVCALAAAWLFGLVRGVAPPPAVMAPTERRVDGVRTTRCRSIDPRDVTVFKAVPITTVPRTLVDLAALLSLDELARACHEAGIRYGTAPAQVDAVLARRPNSRGAGNLRTVLHGDFHVTLSQLEREFLKLLRAQRFPLPVTNRVTGGRRVDCRWPEYRLTVELDGYRFHRSRHAWEQDRRREREARARRDEFRRYTYADVLEDPTYLLRELAELLPRCPA